MRTRSFFGLAVAAVAFGFLTGCAHEASAIDGLFTEEQWAVVESLADVQPVPADPTNRFADDPAAAALGQKLFHESRYSGALTVGDDGMNGSPGAEGETGKLSCASCHVPAVDFTDSRSTPGNVSLGVAYTPRNAPSLINVAFYEWNGWAGKQDSLWTQASLSPESSDNTGGTRCGYTHVMFDHYRTEYEALFGPLPEALAADAPDADRFPAQCKPKKTPEDPDGEWEAMDPADQEAVNQVMANCGKAIAAYERLLVSFDSPFDRYVGGDDTAVSASAKRGLEVFIGDDDLGAFRTKALRNVASSAPYFHAGEVTTLLEVVELYDQGGAPSGFMGTKDERLVPLNLTTQEKDDLVAFLESITGQPLPAELLANTANP